MVEILHLILLFFSDFGVVIGGQSILYCQLTGILLVFHRLGKQRRISSTTLFISLIAALGGMWSLYFNAGKTFGVHSSGVGIVASTVNVVLFAIMLEATRVAFRRFTPQLMYLLLCLHGLYFILEWLTFNNLLNFKPLLQLFHNNPKALEKLSMSLLGREHSYGSMGPLLIMMIASIYYKKRLVSAVGLTLVIMSCVAMIVALTSKTVLFTALVFLGMYFVRLKSITTMSGAFALIVASSGVFYISYRIISAGYIQDILQLQGGSSFARWYFAVAGVYMIFANPVLGVGLGGYKFNFQEAVVEWGIPIRFDLSAILSSDFKGSVDPTNFFIGILSEFGLVLGLPLLLLMFKEYLTKTLSREVVTCFATVSVSFFGFYYWGQPFILVMLLLPLLIRS